jgi:hypothetical protein
MAQQEEQAEDHDVGHLDPHGNQCHQRALGHTSLQDRQGEGQAEECEVGDLKDTEQNPAPFDHDPEKAGRT